MSDQFIRLYIRSKNEPGEVQQLVNNSSISRNGVINKIVNYIKKIFEQIKNFLIFY